MNQLLHVSASPHIKDRVTTSSIMLDVISALIPATLFGIIQFKINALLIIVTTITTCVLAEYLYERFMKKTIMICVLIAGVLASTGCSGSRVKAPKEVFAPEEAFAEIPHTVSGKLIQT